MIKVDMSTGSAELAEPLEARGLPVERTHMSFGDVAWIGRGPGDTLLPVGVEFKKLADVLQCVVDNRFTGHQLPGLHDNYQVVYLLIEGMWRPAKDGGLEVVEHGTWRGSRAPVNYRGLEHWLTTIGEQGGVTVLHALNRESSLAILHARYTWWTSKAWEAHKSLKGIHQPPRARRVSLRRPTWRHRISRTFPGLGDEKSALVEKRFPNVRAMVNANELEWMEVEGVGKETARRIVRAMTVIDDDQ